EEIEEVKSEGKQEPEFQTLEQAVEEINILRNIIRNLEGTRGLDALIGAVEALENTSMEEEKEEEPAEEPEPEPKYEGKYKGGKNESLLQMVPYKAQRQPTVEPE
ncbi:hypothetical protein KI387_041678, partial [Taxus chinensis]